MPERKRLYCIDASIYIFRAYFSMPDRWFSDQGYSLNAVYGYARFLSDFIARESPVYVMAAFDESLGTGFRHQLFEGYKSNRALPDESLAFQLNACRKLTELMGVQCYSGPRYEADDYIASAARQARDQDAAVTLVSRDKDLAQVMEQDEDEWWDIASGRRLRKRQWEAEQGLKSCQVADYLALVGDPVDAIPGVAGVGAVTAKKLLGYYGTLDEIVTNLASLEQSGIRSAKRIADSLHNAGGQLALVRQLTTLSEKALRKTSLERFARQPASGNLETYLLDCGCGSGWAAGISATLNKGV